MGLQDSDGVGPLLEGIGVGPIGVGPSVRDSPVTPGTSGIAA